jgi:hypothetical protein
VNVAEARLPQVEVHDRSKQHPGGGEAPRAVNDEIAHTPKHACHPRTVQRQSQSTP